MVARLNQMSVIVIDTYHRSGQVRLFNVHIQSSCCSARLSWAHVPAPLSQTGKKRGESKGAPPALVGTREYEQSDWNRYHAEGVLRCYGIWNVS